MVTGCPSASAAGRGGLGSQGPRGEETRSPGRSFAHSQPHTHSSQAHVCAYTCMPEDAHSHTPTCTRSDMPHPHMPSNAHTDSLSGSHSHIGTRASTRVHAHVHSYMCVHPHTHQFALKHTHRHAPTPTWCAHTHSLQGLRGPSVGDPVPWARQPGCR